MSSGKKVDVEGKELVDLIKNAGLFKKDGADWFKIKVVPEPKARENPAVIEFADVGPKAFMGYAFSNKINDKLYLEPPADLIKYLKSKKLELVYNSAEPHVIEKENKYGPDVTYGYYTVVGLKSETVRRLTEEIESSESIINLSKSEEVHSKMSRDLLKLLAHNSTTDEILSCLIASKETSNLDREILGPIADALEMYVEYVNNSEETPAKTNPAKSKSGKN